MILGYLCGESPALHGFTENQISLPKIEPLMESVALIEVQSLVLEEEPVLLTPVPPHAALPNRIAVVGNYLPRRCGIATFTTDLCDALHAEYGTRELLALPVNDSAEGYDYPARVRFELSEDHLASYRQAADFLNFSNIDLVSSHRNVQRLAHDLSRRPPDSFELHLPAGSGPLRSSRAG
jgi:hypothetical protein